MHSVAIMDAILAAEARLESNQWELLDIDDEHIWNSTYDVGESIQDEIDELRALLRQRGYIGGMECETSLSQ